MTVAVKASAACGPDAPRTACSSAAASAQYAAAACAAAGKVAAAGCCSSKAAHCLGQNRGTRMSSSKQQVIAYRDKLCTSGATVVQGILTCPRPCSRIAFWKMVSLSPVSIMLSTSASVGLRPVTMCALLSTTSLQDQAKLCNQVKTA